MKKYDIQCNETFLRRIQADGITENFIEGHFSLFKVVNGEKKIVASFPSDKYAFIILE